MKKTISLCALIIITMAFSLKPKSIHQFSTKTLDGKDFSFASLAGKKLLIVNTASECGFTPQYKELQELYDAFKDKNFVVIGFPCNDFGGQEPGTAAEIQTFCSKNYGVTFPMMEKVIIKGNKQSEIYTWLCNKSLNGKEDAEVKWNFSKFLINENGDYVKHLPSQVKPMDPEITSWIEGK